MKIFVLTLTTLALVGCGSKQTKPQQAANGAAASVNAPQSGGAPEIAEDTSPSDVALDAGSPNTAIDPKYKALDQAVRSGHSKGITDQAARLLGVNAYDPVPLNALALLHLKRGHTGAAKILLNKALEKSQSAALYNNLGVALLQEGDEGAALASFKKGYKADVNNQAILSNLGAMYMKGGDFTRAVPLLEQVYKTTPSNLANANNYAIALRSSGDLDGAQKVYDSILKVDPKNIYALLNEAILFVDFQNKPKDGLTLVYKLKFLETDKKDVVARANALEKKAKAGLQ